jgi:YHS domain-containing protein
MIKLVILLICGLVIYGLLRNKILPKKQAQKEIDTTNMERDPICNTYVSDDTEFKLKYYDKMYYFCSQDCMDKFKASKVN